MSTDRLLFEMHISEGEFQSGVDKGYWGIHPNTLELKEHWPKVIIWVQAAYKESGKERYYLCFDLAGYSAVAPTACPWDVELNKPLKPDLWPKGGTLVDSVFKHSWRLDALYIPCDRVAIPGHDGWRTQYPNLWWQPHFKIDRYLNHIHLILNSSEYAKA